MPRCILVRDRRFAIGGLETWSEILAAGLPGCGIDVTLLVVGDAKPYAARFPRCTVTAVAAYDDPAEQAAAIIKACRDLAQAGESGVAFTLGYLYLCIVGLNLLRSPWVPLPVVHGRDPGIVEWISIGPPRRVVTVAGNMEGALSRDLRDRVGLLRSWRRVLTIPNGVFLPPGEEIDRKLAMFPSPFRAVAVSRLDPEAKRPLDYAAIARRIAEERLPFTFTIIGSGSLEDAVRRESMGTATMAGALPRDRVYDELLRSDVFLLTSEREASSMAVAEALACGCAVVAAESDGTRGIAGTTLVRVGAIEEFMTALRRFASDPAGMRDQARVGRAFAEREYSEDEMVRRYAALIRRLCRHARPNPKWTPASPILQTPGDALPRGAAARVRSGIAAVMESFTT